VASVTFHPDLQRFPIGTTTTLYKQTCPRNGEQSRLTGNPETWASPHLVKVLEIAVVSPGTLAVPIGTGAGELPQGTPGLIAAEVAGEWRYLTVRNPVAVAAGSEPT